MKIAVTYHDGSVFEHFGHTKALLLAEVEAGQVKSSQVLPVTGGGHSAMAQLLKEKGVEVLICGGIGGGAMNALAALNIKVYPGVKGAADKAVEGYLNGTLKPGDAANCNHHHHDHGHSCSCGHDCECGH